MNITSKKEEYDDYYKRIENYKKIIRYFKNIKNNQCLVPIKKRNNYLVNYYEYNLNNNKIILKKRIGSNSRYGVIYLTHLKLNEYLFATKLTPINIDNNFEIKLVKKLSKITLYDLNPHFLLTYKNLYCYNEENTNKLPTIIKNNNYNILINELADENLKNFLKYINDSELILNAYQQIFISILSFHYFTKGLYHGDCHYKNFLYKKINPGGYFHYNIFGEDIYIENKGYIWFIWDFGLVKAKYNKKKRLEDYIRINYFFKPNEEYNNNNKFILVNEYVKKIEKMEFLDELLFKNSDVNFFKDFLFKFKNLYSYKYNKYSFIINKFPYIIKKFK